MTARKQISIFGALVAAIAAALLIYWWDSAHEGTIAEGVTIGGVDVGGLEAAEAGAQIRSNLVKPLDKPVKVKVAGERFKLEPEQISIRADIDGMVGEALEASEEGGVFGRSWRRLTGGEVEHAVPPKIAYSEKGVSEFVDSVAAAVNREPVNAKVEPSADGIEPVSSRNGIDLAEKQLRRDVERALQDPAMRRVEGEVEKVKPEVTTEQLASAYPTYITVDRSNFTLRLYKDLELAKAYTVALGKAGHDTPTGLYDIESKAVDPVWNVPDSDWAGELAGRTIPPGPDNPLKARWLGIYNGAGIHGTSDIGSLGSAASHGCIRMAVDDVIDLYDRVPTGTPIYIS